MAKDKSGKRSCSTRGLKDETIADFGSRRRRTPGIISLGGPLDPAEVERLMHTKPTFVVVDIQPRFSPSPADKALYANEENLVFVEGGIGQSVTRHGFAHDVATEASMRRTLDALRDAGVDIEEAAVVTAAHDRSVHDAAAWDSAPDPDLESYARLMLDRVRG